MPLDPPRTDFSNQRDRDQWARRTKVVPSANSVTDIEIADGAVSNSKLRASAAASVIGRIGPSSGTPSDIIAPSDNTFLVRRAGLLTFGAIADADIPATITRDSELADAITAETASILALPDPFTQYLTNTRADARYQKLPLTASATYDPPSLAAGIGVTTTITITGAVMGNYVTVSFSNDLQGITLTGYISVANTAAVRFQNGTAGTIDLASGTLNVRVES